MQSVKVFLVVLLLLAFEIVLAQEEEIALDEEVTAQNLNISEPTLLPDSPFYFFKNWGREIRTAFSFSPLKKAELREKFANEKLIELKKVAEKTKNSQVIKKATENYQKEIKRLGEATERIKEKAETNNQVGQFLDKFIQQQTLHQRVLQKLENQVPAEAFEKIKEARERHLEKFGEVMTRLENKEKIQERLEKNLEKVKGSEFKEFKNLELLKDLEEKVPEEAKEAMRQSQQNTLLRLKTTVEKMAPKKLETFKSYTESIAGEKEKQIEILDNLREELKAKPIIREKLRESREKILEKITPEIKP